MQPDRVACRTLPYVRPVDAAAMRSGRWAGLASGTPARQPTATQPSSPSAVRAPKAAAGGASWACGACFRHVPPVAPPSELGISTTQRSTNPSLTHCLSVTRRSGWAVSAASVVRLPQSALIAWPASATTKRQIGLEDGRLEQRAARDRTTQSPPTPKQVAFQTRSTMTSLPRRRRRDRHQESQPRRNARHTPQLPRCLPCTSCRRR